MKKRMNYLLALLVAVLIIINSRFKIIEPKYMTILIGILMAILLMPLFSILSYFIVDRSFNNEYKKITMDSTTKQPREVDAHNIPIIIDELLNMEHKPRSMIGRNNINLLLANLYAALRQFDYAYEYMDRVKTFKSIWGIVLSEYNNQITINKDSLKVARQNYEETEKIIR